MSTVTTGALLLSLTSCGDGDSSNAGSDESVELRVSWWGSAERTELTNQALEAFEAETGYSVSGEAADFSGYFDRLATSVAGGDAPDVFTLGGSYPAEYANRGALLDLASVSESLDLSLIDDTALQNGMADQSQYALSTGSNALAVLVNPSVFDSSGVDAPDPETWTWDDYHEAATAVSAAGSGQSYGSDNIITHDTVDAFARQNGETLYTEDGSIGVTEETLTELFAIAQDLTAEGGTPDASVLNEQQSVSPEQTLLATGDAAMMITWSNTLSTLADASSEELELWPLPSEAETPGVWQQSSQYYAISADSENPEAAAELLDFLVNTEEAVEILGLDRGVPDNPEMREHIAPTLDETGRAEVDYIELVSSRDTADRFIGPAGSTTVEDTTVRIADSLLRELLTPQEAASQWLEETRSAVGN